MKKFFPALKKLLTLLVGGLAYGVLFYRLFAAEHVSAQSVLRSVHINFPILVLLIGVWLAYIVSQGWYLKKVLNKWDVPIGTLKSVEVWLATVAMGLVTFGVSGFAIIFYESKKRLQSKDNKLPSTIAVSYYIGYILATVLFFGLTVALIVLSQNLQWMLLVGPLLLLVIWLFWREPQKIREETFEAPHGRWFTLPKNQGKYLFDLLSRQIPLAAVPTVVFNFGLFVLSFALLGLHLPFFDYLKVFDLEIILSIISPSSGGLGFVEIGLLKFIQLNGLDATQAALVTVVYRLISLWLTALVGYLAILILGVKRSVITTD